MNPFVHDENAVDGTVTRPVTERSRITGVEASPRAASHLPPVRDARVVDWPAVVASVVAGLAITATLLILGISTGLIAGDEGTSAEGAAGILGGIGAWAVVCMIVGSFVGSVLGGRLARWMDRGSIAYHTLTSWGLATLLSILLVTMVVIGFASTATSAATSAVAADQVTDGTATNGAANAGAAGTASNEPDAAGGDSAAADRDASGANSGDNAANDAADALGGAGVALTLGMLLTLAASFAGWWVGSRKKLTDFEREDAEEPVVA